MLLKNVFNVEVINKSVEETCKKDGIKLRPYASAGFWVSFLLPIAISLAMVKFPFNLSFSYKLAATQCVGIIITNIFIIIQCIRYKNFEISKYNYLSTIIIFLFYCIYVKQGYIFGIYGSLISTIIYYKSLPFILKKFPLCFTFGEAASVTQAFILFLCIAPINIYRSIIKVPVTNTATCTLILQVGIIGFTIIVYNVHKFNFCRKPFGFYTLTILTLILFIILPLQIILKQNILLWIFNLLTRRLDTMCVIVFWSICIFLAAFTVNKQIQANTKANTSIRKIFHILIFVVYLSGLIGQCSILYLASGIIFVLFMALEMVRKLNLPPFEDFLQNGFKILVDEKDVGNVALTPIYLLVGCSLPLWIHPHICNTFDVLDYHLITLMSGILSIGIGDTAASYFGSKYGKHYWPNSKKTYEGTIACIFFQLFVVLILIYFGLIAYTKNNIIKTCIAILTSSLIEAKTDQIDNGILPLIMYIIFFSFE